jgi:hypothetical protein
MTASEQTRVKAAEKARWGQYILRAPGLLMAFICIAAHIVLGLIFIERYSPELPAWSVKFECRDDVNYVGKLGEAISVSRGQNLSIL